MTKTQNKTSDLFYFYLYTTKVSSKHFLHVITLLPSFQNKSNFQQGNDLHVVVSGASRRELIIGWLGSSYIDKPSSQSGYYARRFQPTMLSVESSRVLRVSRDSRAQCRNVAQGVIMQCSIVPAEVQKCAIMLPTGSIV